MRRTLGVSVIVSFLAIGFLSGCATNHPSLDPKHVWMDTDQTPYPFSQAAAKEFVGLLSAEGSQTSAIVQSWNTWNREATPAQERLELKFAYLSFREQLTAQVIRSMQAKKEIDVQALDTLITLRATLTPEELKILAEYARGLPGEAVDKLLELIELQGNQEMVLSAFCGADSALRERIRTLRDGPSFLPHIPASHGSEWPWQRILNEPEFSDSSYQRDSTGAIKFRGLRLVPGDVLLVNLQNPTEGLFTAFGNATNYIFHAATYAELPGKGGIYPVVFESYEFGVRIVPLANYLSPSMTAFVEVYHDPSVNAQTRAALSTAVQLALARPVGFNLTFDDKAGGTSWISCSTAISNVFASAGFPLPPGLSTVDSKVLPILGTLKTTPNPYFTPTDFLSRSEYQPIGVIDNRELPHLLSTTLIMHEFRHWAQSGIFEGDSDWEFYRDAVIHIQNREFWEGFLLGLFGFTRDTFPKGTAPTLALVMRLEEELEPAVHRTTERFAQSPELLNANTVFSIDRFLKSPVLKDLARIEGAKVAAWFEKK